MKLVRIVAMAIGFATVLRAQNPATEQEWRSELATTRDQPGTGASSRAGHFLCDGYAYRTDWRMLGPGLGLAGAGVTLTGIFAIRESKAARRIKDLDNIGSQRHWS